MRYFVDDGGKYREVSEKAFCDMKQVNDELLSQALNYGDLGVLEKISFLFVTDDDGVIRQEGK